MGNKRMITRFDYQEKPENLEVFVDSDFAGCLRSRKSTSGGMIMYGSHLIKHWASTQSVIALSSGEAEYYALVKGSGQAIGMCSMIRELGV